MNIPPLISDLALILMSAGLTTIIFKWLKQPVVLGYIVAGCLVSSQITLTPTVSGTSDIGTWADIGVVFLLFSLGLDFSFKKLMNVGRTAIIAALVIVMFMIVLGFLVGMAMGWGVTNSALVGGMVSMSSTAIIIKAFDDMGLRSQKFTKIVFGILIFEDLIAIVLLVLISTLFVGKSFEGSDLIFAVAKLVFFLVVWMVGGIYFIPMVLRKAKGVMNDETLLVFSLGLCFGMVLFAMKAGFSSALGAFVMGSILAETLEAEHIERIVRPLKDLFGAIFFVSVGMMVDFSVIAQYLVPIVILVFTVVVGQISFSTIGLLLSGQSLKVAMQSGFCLTQIGEFAFIIALLGVNLGIIDEFVYPVIVAVSVITIFLTPYVMRMRDGAYNFVSRHLPERWLSQLERRGNWKTLHSENVWHSLLVQIVKITVVYSILSLAILIACFNYLKPFVLSFVPGFWGKLIVTIVAIVLISPLLRAIVAKKNHSVEYKHLWAQNKFNHVPLVMLVVVRFMWALSFVAVAVDKILEVHIGIVILIAALSVFLMFASRRLKLFSIKMERKFFHNLNSREYEMKQKSVREGGYRQVLAAQLSSYDIHLVDYTVASDSVCVGKTLRELDYHRRFGVHIVSILRGGHRINIPGGDAHLYPTDKILVLGTDAQLETFQNEINMLSEAEEDDDRSVSMEQFEVMEDSPLCNKSVREAHLRESLSCLVVGVEREGTSTMNPDVDMVFRPGDLVWVAGETAKLHELVGEDNVIRVAEC